MEGGGTDSAAIYQEMAYEKMFADSLQKAEQYAYRAFLLSRDSTLECGALSLLCYIYYREGKQRDLQLLMQTISPDAYMDIMDVQLRVEQAKAGIDVLFAIINDQNISQMGKQEEQAVLRTLPIIDSHLAVMLDKAVSPLTPKETFFCIMEYYGKSDKQKARSFCCSEQAIRSTKSRLHKKFDISTLRPE